MARVTLGALVFAGCSARGHDPIAYDSLLEGNVAAIPDAAQRLVVGDIAETDRLAEVMKGHAIEAVMHFAALASVPDSIADPEAYYRVNVGGTKSVLDAMRGEERIERSSSAARPRPTVLMRRCRCADIPSKT